MRSAAQTDRAKDGDTDHRTNVNPPSRASAGSDRSLISDLGPGVAPSLRRCGVPPSNLRLPRVHWISSDSSQRPMYLWKSSPPMRYAGLPKNLLRAANPKTNPAAAAPERKIAG